MRAQAHTYTHTHMEPLQFYKLILTLAFYFRHIIYKPKKQWSGCFSPSEGPQAFIQLNNSSLMLNFPRNASLQQTHMNSTLAPAAANEEILTSLLKAARRAGKTLPFLAPPPPFGQKAIYRSLKALSLSHAGCAELAVSRNKGAAARPCAPFSVPCRNRWARAP